MSKASKSTTILDFIFSKLDEKLAKLERLDRHSKIEIAKLKRKVDNLTNVLGHAPPSTQNEKSSIFESFKANYNQLFPVKRKTDSPASKNSKSDINLQSESEIEDIILYHSREKMDMATNNKDLTLDSEDTMTDVEAANPFAPKFEIAMEFSTSNDQAEEPMSEKKEIKSFSKYKTARRKLSANKKNFESSEESENPTVQIERVNIHSEIKAVDSIKKSPERPKNFASLIEKIEIKATQEIAINTDPFQVPEPEKLSAVMLSPPKLITLTF
jgi:hypothetical protein